MHDPGQWFALRVRPRYERQVSDAIAAKGYGTLFPTYAISRRWSDRVKKMQAPLFDGYVFCQLDVTERLPVLTTPGVLHFVGVGKSPVPIDPAEILSIQTAVQSGSLMRPWPFLREGERVRISDGPLRNVEGILLHANRDDLVVLSVSLLQRSIAVNIDRRWIMPIRPWLR